MKERVLNKQKENSSQEETEAVQEEKNMRKANIINILRDKEIVFIEIQIAFYKRETRILKYINIK